VRLPDGLCVAGVDVGSTLTKVVLHNGDFLASAIDRTQVDYVGAARRLLAEVLGRAGRAPDDLTYVVATGYGRRRIPFASREITEITCHARGVRELFPAASTVIDVGGQDAKGIKLNAQGKVVNFAMNDKCAAGTGRFLEVMAASLGLPLDELGTRGLGGGSPVSVSSICTVFAEQEVAQHLAAGVPVEDVLAGLHAALASRILVMVRRLGIEQQIVLTGGCAHNPALVRALAERLGAPVVTPPEPMLTGALGAALLAREAVERGEAPAGGVSLAEGRTITVAAGVALAPDAGAGLPASLTRARPRPRAFDGDLLLPGAAIAAATPTAGVDVGALFTKAAVLWGNRVAFAVFPSEGSYAGVGEQALRRALDRLRLGRGELGGLVATGLGAASLRGARAASEVSCLARGMARLCPEAGQVIDIGAHGTRVIRLTAPGAVKDFSVSGQCAAGSARILEVVAHLLGLEVAELGALSLRATRPANYSASCAVFAETEAISLLTRGVSREDLMAGLHDSLAQKIAALARGPAAAGACGVAGGGAKDIGLLARLEASLGALLLPPEPMVVAALGGALLAADGGA
jgi:(R)-2-hydroxyacyl-CoA dehydratese activating ATPase